MRRIFLMGLLLANCFTAGCANISNPFRQTAGGERPDSSNYSIAEQERRGRAAWSLPDEGYLGGPRSGSAHAIMDYGQTNGINSGR